MSHNTRTLLTIAAEMRAVGHPWTSVAATVHRKPETCQKWPARFRDDWDDLYRTAQRKRFDETSNEAHSLLKGLMRSDDSRVQHKAIELWLKCGANAYGLQGRMVAPAPAAGETADDDLWAAARKDMTFARDRMDRRRAHLGLPPLTDDEFLTEYEEELNALLHPPPAPPPAPSISPVVCGLLLVVGILLGGRSPSETPAPTDIRVASAGPANPAGRPLPPPARVADRSCPPLGPIVANGYQLIDCDTDSGRHGCCISGRHFDSNNSRGRRADRLFSGECAVAAKQLTYADDARQKLLSGVSKLAKAVRSTLGPRGRNAVLDKGWGSPTVTKDGVSVAEDIELKDPYENMGAQLVKEAARKTSDVAGDGTTTATVLAEFIYREGLKAVAAGSDPMAVVRGIQKGVDAVVESLKGLAQKIDANDNKAITEVATIAANNDKEIGAKLAEAMQKVGAANGVITIEEGKTAETEVVVVQGMQFDRGYLSPHFVTNQEDVVVEFENAHILIYEDKISNAKDSCRCSRPSTRRTSRSSSSPRTSRATPSRRWCSTSSRAS